MIGEQTVVDSTRAALVWEPGRVVPEYAVPAEDARGETTEAGRLAVEFDARSWRSRRARISRSRRTSPPASTCRERVDVVVDGERREWPVTPWS